MLTNSLAGENKLSDEEAGKWILATAKHLKAFSSNEPRLSALYATTRSAQQGELLLRIRGLGTVAPSKIEAFAYDVGIPRQELIATLERIENVTSLISVERFKEQQTEVAKVYETILTEQEVFRAIAALFRSLTPSPAERILAPLLELMSRLPLTEDEVVSQMCKRGFDEENVRKAIELQEAFQLVQRRRVDDLGVTLLYNEYLWGNKIQQIGELLSKLGSKETEELLLLMDEVRGLQGQAIDRLGSASPQIINLAARTGIIDTTTITTASGDEKTFVFSPHFYGYRTGVSQEFIEDSTDQVKLFVASMTYGVNYSPDFRLHSPLAFVERLLNDGEAGNATPILRDYILLERHGIVAVKEKTYGRGTFVLQKPDVVARAFEVMTNGALLQREGTAAEAQGLFAQRDYRSPEVNRIRSLAQPVGMTARHDEEMLIGRIREAAQRGSW